LKLFSTKWYEFLNILGEFPNNRNMKTVEIFDELEEKGLDIGHDGNYILKNGNVGRFNIHPFKDKKAV